jgi:hypothetical protein
MDQPSRVPGSAWACTTRGLPGFRSWFATDADCLDRPRLAAAVRRIRVPQVRAWRLGRGRWAVQVRGLRQSDLGDGGHAVRPQADAADRLVQSLLDVRCPKGRRLGAEPAAGAGDRLVRDGVGDAAPLRSVLVPPDRHRLSGTVEVDETLIGGEEAGPRGGRTMGKKLLVGVAVEVRQPRGTGAAGWGSCPTPRSARRDECARRSRGTWPARPGRRPSTFGPALPAPGPRSPGPDPAVIPCPRSAICGSARAARPCCLRSRDPGPA